MNSEQTEARLEPSSSGELRVQSQDTPETETPPVGFRSPHDFKLARATLARRKDELEKFAKSVEGQGYVREARAIRSDAQAIQYTILPAFDRATMPTLDLDDREALTNDLVSIIRPMLQRARTRKDAPEKTAEELAGVLTIVLRTAVEMGYADGFAARFKTPDHLASRAIGVVVREALVVDG